MGFQRRQVLQILSYTFGSSFILPQNGLAMAAQNPAQPASPAPPAKADCKTRIGRNGNGKSSRNRWVVLPSS